MIRVVAWIGVLLAAKTLLAAMPVSAQVSPAAFTTATRYDVAGRVTGTIAPDPDGSGLLNYGQFCT